LESFFLLLSNSCWGHRHEKELDLCLVELPDGEEDSEDAIEDVEEEDEEDERDEGEGVDPVEERELNAPMGTFPLRCLFRIKEIVYSFKSMWKV
jgi:hypothetical protein